MHDDKHKHHRYANIKDKRTRSIKEALGFFNKDDSSLVFNLHFFLLSKFESS